MDTIQDIRRANLLALLAEVEAEIGRSRGAPAELSRRTKVPPPVLSQFLNRRKHSSSGSERAIGDKIARQIERGMNKNKGWLDVIHENHLPQHDLELLQTIRLLTAEQRELIERQAQELARLNRRASGDGDPAPHTPLRPH